VNINGVLFVKICLSVTSDVATDQRVNKIAQTLKGMGAEVTVIGRKKMNSLPFRTDGITIKLFNLPFSKGPMFYASYNIRAFLYLLGNRFDILVANDLDTLPANFAASRIKRKRLVYDSHEYFTEVPELVGRKWTKKIWETIEQLLLPRILYAITVSDSIARSYYKKYGIRMVTVRNVPLCETEEDAHDYSPDIKGKLIIYQGSLNMGRGLELVIRSMRHVPSATFLIAGDGDIAGKLKELTEELGLTDRIRFTGRIPFGELSSYTRRADLGISLEENLGLNYYYALPNKLFDYIKANVPVLVSDFPEMGALVKKYGIGLTTLSRDPEEVAGLINLMLTDKIKIKLWKNNLREAAKELCWEKESEKLIGLYRSVNAS